MRTDVLLLVIITLCIIPEIYAFDADISHIKLESVPPLAQSFRQSAMYHHQQQQRVPSTSMKASKDGEVMATLPTIETDTTEYSLFPPTSKYHPDQDGLQRRRRWLVVDFDGTCTEHDTTPLLPRLAAFATRQRSSIQSSCGDKNEDAEHKKEANIDNDNNSIANDEVHMVDLERRISQFQHLEEEYMRRYGETKSSLIQQQHQSIHDMLDALDEPSTIVTQMVSESRVLEGLGHVDADELGGILQLHTDTTTPTEFESSGTEVECMSSNETNKSGEGEFDKVVVRIRHSCQNTLARILSESSNHHDADQRDEGPPACLGWNLAVLSINWCPALIDASIVQPVLKQRRSVLQIDKCTTEVPIWSNQVDADGVISLNVPGALAKRDRIRELRRNIHQSSDSTSVIVYVGDSSTDLAALLEADIGVIMGQTISSSMTVIAERWGIQIVPLKHRSQHDFDVVAVDGNFERWRKQNILWHVESWMEIDEMLLELDRHWS
ncbi:hypothetical protein ACHAWU_007190 [Discostella pseudostelligera]|uniref:Uncharacterized protein n=1 Tax=Discostella pseudostelligera TaxID=259834 RepID=A0ABD3M0H8_9STRA